MTDLYGVPPEQYIRNLFGANGDMAGLLTDKEIADALVMYGGNWRLAASNIAMSLASRAQNDPKSFSLAGVMSVDLGDKADLWYRIGRSLLQENEQMTKAEYRPEGLRVTQLRRGTAKVTQEYTVRRG